jgi:hypothetical protein
MNECVLSILPFITPLTVLGSAVFALYQYQRQRKFIRIQNLSSIWKKFIDDKDLLDLFVALDEGNLNSIAITQRQQKFRFLGLLEEVSLYAKKFELDNDYALYLFQWHFEYVFNQKDTSEAFWRDLGGESEMNQHYWSMSRSFAKKCRPSSAIG